MGDEGKRKQYDTYGVAGDEAPGGSARSGSTSGFQYQSQVDPEELFRTIFGDAFRRGQGFESMFDNNNFGSDSQQQQYEPAQVGIFKF